MHSVIAVLPREVIKRDGRRVAFDPGKIRSAILRAGQAAGEMGAAEFGENEADLLTAQATFRSRYNHLWQVVFSRDGLAEPYAPAGIR